MNTYNDSVMDVLKELSNIGAGNAATALSLLLNKKINMNVPTAKLVSFNEIMDLIGGAERPVAAVFLKMEGEIEGSLFFVLSLEDATRFVQQLTHDPTTKFEKFQYEEMAISALQELGNIIAAHYLSAISNSIGQKCTPSVPIVAIDMVGAIVTEGLLQVSEDSDHAIFIDTRLEEITDDSIHQAKGHFFLIPYQESLEKIMRTLGVK
ncbi:chemotaxis protein CheC [Sutcliffiella cohnii]